MTPVIPDLTDAVLTDAVTDAVLTDAVLPRGARTGPHGILDPRHPTKESA